MARLFLLPLLALPGAAPARLAQTPPMGWMSWEKFRCEVDCAASPDACINEALYEAQADALADEGYVAAGYETVSIDDCWEAQAPREPGVPLTMNATRFPSGPEALGARMRAKGVKFGIYSDEGSQTCGGYPGSQGFEALDAQTFAAWGVAYLKLDGCNNDATGFETGYPAMGEALARYDIVYSCSWPAYLGDDEGAKPFASMVDAGCNLWRNWRDIQCSWPSLKSVIDHWGNYSDALRAAAGPGHWNDPDMLLVGNACITDFEAETQMAIWSVVAAPLIMGNDLRKVSAPMKALLQNPEVIAVDQDPLGRPGGRLSPAPGPAEVWTRDLAGGALAVAVLFDAAGAKATLTFGDLKYNASAKTKVRDLLRREDLATLGPGASLVLEAPGDHSVRFLRLDAA